MTEAVDYECIKELPARTRNGLCNLLAPDKDITPEKVAQFSRGALLRLPNMGNKSIRDIEDWLSQRGLKLRTPEPETNPPGLDHSRILSKHIQDKIRNAMQSALMSSLNDPAVKSAIADVAPRVPEDLANNLIEPHIRRLLRNAHARIVPVNNHRGETGGFAARIQCGYAVYDIPLAPTSFGAWQAPASTPSAQCAREIGRAILRSLEIMLDSSDEAARHSARGYLEWLLDDLTAMLLRDMHADESHAKNI